MSTLLIAVPRARKFCGRAIVLSGDGATILGPVRILATASARVARANGNPGCSPNLPFGHPPLGSYVVAASLPPGHRHRRPRRYGRLGALVLEPVAGDAAVAGRRVVLHGGPLDPKGRLRPTRGGLRVSDRDMAALLSVLNDANAANDPLRSVEIVDAGESLTSTALDLPGGRGIATFRNGRLEEVARRKFLAASALLLAGMAAGEIGCIDERPSCCQPVRSDWQDAGSTVQDAPSLRATQDAQSSPDSGHNNGSSTGAGGSGQPSSGGIDNNGGYTTGGGYG